MNFLLGILLIVIPLSTAVACIVSVMSGPDKDAAAYVIGVCVTGVLTGMLFAGLKLVGF